MERLKPKVKNEKVYHISLSISKKNSVSSPNLVSEVVSYNPKEIFTKKKSEYPE